MSFRVNQSDEWLGSQGGHSVNRIDEVRGREEEKESYLRSLARADRQATSDRALEQTAIAPGF